MSAPWDRQKELADLLTTKGLLTTPEVPEVKTPPFRYILTADPWIASGQSFGSWRVRFRVVCVVAPGTNVVQLTQLGDMVRAVIVALKGSPFAVEADAVDEPSRMAERTLGAVVNISAGISRAQFEEEPTP